MLYQAVRFNYLFCYSKFISTLNDLKKDNFENVPKQHIRDSSYLLSTNITSGPAIPNEAALSV